MTYIDLASLKIYLGVIGSSDDTLLTNIANSVETFVENYTGRVFTSTTYTNEEYEGTDSFELKLKNYPIISLSYLGENENYLENENDWDTIDAEDYWIDEYSGDRGIIRANFKFAKYPHHYRVTYVAGYATIPEDLKMAIYDICGTYYNCRKTAGIDRERVGDYDVTFGKGGAVSDLAGSILTNYKDYSKNIE